MNTHTQTVRSYVRRKPVKKRPAAFNERMRELEIAAARNKPMLEIERAILRASLEIMRENDHHG